MNLISTYHINYDISEGAFPPRLSGADQHESSLKDRPPLPRCLRVDATSSGSCHTSRRLDEPWSRPGRPGIAHGHVDTAPHLRERDWAAFRGSRRR